MRFLYEKEFAQNPSYVHLYRKGNAYHGAHPFYMWYWGENGRQHVRHVIAAGAENAHVPAMLGWERADNLTEAIAMARNYMGNSAEITMLHQPVQARHADVVHSVDAITHDLRGQRGFFGDGDIAGARGNRENRTFAAADPVALDSNHT